MFQPDVSKPAPPSSTQTTPFAEPANLSSLDILRLLPRAWPFIKPYTRDLVRLFLIALPGVAAGLVFLLLTQIFFDTVGNGHPLSALGAWFLRLPPNASREAVLWRCCIVTAIAAAVAAPVGMFIVGYGIWILQRISNLFRTSLYDRLQELSVSFHSEEKIGDAIFRMFQDAASFPEVISGLLFDPIRLLPFALADLVWLARLNYLMAAIALLLIPANLLIARFLTERLRRAFREAREAVAAATSRVEETIASFTTVKAFGREAYESELYARESWAAFLAMRRARMLAVVYRATCVIVRGTAYVAVLYLGVHQVLTGAHGGWRGAAISLGLFQTAILAFGGMAGRMEALTVKWAAMQDVGVGLARVFQMLDKPPEPARSEGVLATPRRVTELRFDNVRFAYSPASPVLSGVSLTARAGEITVVAGPSGSGKSTIISLLLGFFDPTSGRILLDGNDMNDFALDRWRAAFSVVLQDAPLFSASLRDNLTYGCPNAGAAQIRSAIHLAGLSEFVTSLPAGLDTTLGEKGAKISTGQAQRIALARALLRESPILLLDEPTSALDVATEEHVMRGLRAWLCERPTDRIVILTTHRRTAAARADRIYRISAGRIAPADEFAFAQPPMLEQGNG